MAFVGIAWRRSVLWHGRSGVFAATKRVIRASATCNAAAGEARAVNLHRRLSASSQRTVVAMTSHPPNVSSIGGASSDSERKPQQPKRKTAAVMIIGDEILTGKTADTNSHFLAEFLYGRGVLLRRVEVIPDDVGDIVEAAKRLSERFDYVFTSGGIGPTHDDLTYEALAKAFNVPLEVDEQVVAAMRVISQQHPLNEARLRMATLPTGSEKLFTDGLWVPLVVLNKNVYVLPGVPPILQRMVHAAASRFGSGEARARRMVYTRRHEGDIAASLSAIVESAPDVSVGSYPRTSREDRYTVKLTVEGDDAHEVDQVAARIQDAVDGVEDVNQL